MRNCLKTIYLLLALLILTQCKDPEEKSSAVNMRYDMKDSEFQFITYEFCSKNLSFDEQVVGNTIINLTENKNFLKCTHKNDNEYEFSCGKGNKEVLVYKFKCEYNAVLNFDGISMPSIDYDDDDFFVLYHKAGSDSWLNYFVLPSRDKIFSAQALFIDYENRNYVYLDSNDYLNGNVYFIIHKLMSDTRDTIKSNYYKYKKDGHPALNIKNVSINADTLFYSIDDKNGDIKDAIPIH